MSDSDEFAEYISRQRETWLEEVNEWLRIPSVSTDPERRDDMRAAAEWLVEKLEAAGCQETGVWPTEGHPVVFGAYRTAESAPTVLVYGHYDVQPEDPIEGWESPPFEPTVRDGRLFARGAVDDKGQLYVHVKALETWLATRGSCPVNILYLIEGEEEIGSPNVGKVVREKIEKLACDAVVISDTSMFAPGLPSLCYGLRGMAYCQIDVRGPKGDLHSGSFGGALVNPAEALARLLAGCRDAETGAITIPGFLDDVLPLTEEERRDWEELPFDEGAYRDDLGVAALSFERDFGVLERLWARQTFEVNGLGPGAALGAPDVRGQWSALGFYRCGQQDGLARNRDGEGEHAPGAQPGPGQDHGCPRGAFDQARARWDHPRGYTDARCWGLAHAA